MNQKTLKKVEAADRKFYIKSEKGNENIDVYKCEDKEGNEKEVWPGAKRCGGLRDLKDTLCWCWNLDPDTFGVAWEGTTNNASYGVAWGSY